MLLQEGAMIMVETFVQLKNLKFEGKCACLDFLRYIKWTIFGEPKHKPYESSLKRSSITH